MGSPRGRWLRLLGTGADEPDPSTARTVAEFVQTLRQLKIWAGDPSFKRLERLSGVPHSTLGRALDPTRARLPAIEVLRPLVQACGASTTTVVRWEHAWRRLKVACGEPSGRLIPAQLPADIAHFAGRDEELATLDRLVERGTCEGIAASLLVISGAAGTGKTSLAVHWAHRVAARFPDGQLYLNLRGFDPSGIPMDPTEAIDTLLDTLDVPIERIPAGRPAKVGLYRSLLAGRRVLVVLDNACDCEQLRPLLPSAAGCTAVVTSRDDLTGLVVSEGAQPLTIDVLPAGDAVRLLRNRLGEARVVAEPQATAEIVELCARLPLALAIAAARAAARADLPLAAVASELRGTAGTLEPFEVGDPVTDVRTVFSWSYRTLSPDAARLFRLLGAHPGPDITIPAAASLSGTTAHRVRPLLAELARTHLLSTPTPGRYTFHDLLRAYATELGSTTDGKSTLGSARRRVVDHYVHTACAAKSLIGPNRQPVALVEPEPGTIAEHFAGADDAQSWLIAERPVLLATLACTARSGLDLRTWYLAWALTTLLDRRADWLRQVDTQLVALKAARRLGDPAMQAYNHRMIGRALTRLRRYHDASSHLRHALNLYDQVGDQAGLALSHLCLGHIYEQRGRYSQALAHAQTALELNRSAGNVPDQGHALNAVGWLQSQLGNQQQALVHCGQALGLLREIGDRYGQAATYDSLGCIHRMLGDHAQAVSCYEHAVNLSREIGDRYAEGKTLARIGDAHHATDRLAEAQGAWQRAMAILDELGDPDADRIRGQLAISAGQAGHPRPRPQTVPEVGTFAE